MPSGMLIRLRDGATAKVTVSVEFVGKPVDDEGRRVDLENLLGGTLAGVATRTIEGNVVGAIASNGEKLPDKWWEGYAGGSNP